ncbi:unnamed protein product [Lepeophtheirus salmonis]|uniref:(salmon louse) hypothetical protein n=1 Tax=Lepeophtheirus salmonis TaxID=72036 RepID=A0A7R8CE41_LEPSM|nr:unnamed protein product [Lepeophtheirus salmonis]CAF2792001.1 unnamed protein product [Lepeophtheirus salmonis]
MLGYKNWILIDLRKEIDIGISFANVDDEFVIRKLDGDINGIKGAVRGLKAQARDKYGNPIIYEKEITIDFPQKDIKVEDIIETFKEFEEVIGPVKECCFREGRLKGLMNEKYLVKVTPRIDIPGFLPIKVLKTRVSYVGQGKHCANCYQGRHFAKDCSNKLA